MRKYLKPQNYIQDAPRLSLKLIGTGGGEDGGGEPLDSLSCEGSTTDCEFGGAHYLGAGCNAGPVDSVIVVFLMPETECPAELNQLMSQCNLVSLTIDGTNYTCGSLEVFAADQCDTPAGCVVAMYCNDISGDPCAGSEHHTVSAVAVCDGFEEVTCAES